jgi:predicted transcriptional regulator
MTIAEIEVAAGLKRANTSVAMYTMLKAGLATKKGKYFPLTVNGMIVASKLAPNVVAERRLPANGTADTTT